jgi:hypothetical protein
LRLLRGIRLLLLFRDIAGLTGLLRLLGGEEIAGLCALFILRLRSLGTGRLRLLLGGLTGVSALVGLRLVASLLRRIERVRLSSCGLLLGDIAGLRTGLLLLLGDIAGLPCFALRARLRLWVRLLLLREVAGLRTGLLLLLGHIGGLRRRLRLWVRLLLLLEKVAGLLLLGHVGGLRRRLRLWVRLLLLLEKVAGLLLFGYVARLRSHALRARLKIRLLLLLGVTGRRTGLLLLLEKVVGLRRRLGRLLLLRHLAAALGDAEWLGLSFSGCRLRRSCVGVGCVRHLSEQMLLWGTTFVSS